MKKIIISICVCATMTVFTGCADFFEQESDHVAFAEDYKLDNTTDTLYGVIGILNKMQKLADRTILLGVPTTTTSTTTRATTMRSSTTATISLPMSTPPSSTAATSRSSSASMQW